LRLLEAAEIVQDARALERGCGIGRFQGERAIEILQRNDEIAAHARFTRALEKLGGWSLSPIG
jgi:hypothetical protein